MFAIVDVETTGLDPAEDRIIEIAAIRFDGVEVLETYETLIDPGIQIMPGIERLTGITNHQLQQAPKFHQVAKKIVEMTRDCVLVGHHIRFDYAFLRKEFARLGYTFRRKQLCTEKLSRQHFRGLPSYRLSQLCRHFGLREVPSHRAMSDAQATLQLFRLLCAETKPNAAPQSTFQQAIKDNVLPSAIDRATLNNISDATGVYFFYNRSGELIYVGKSKNIRKRIMSHFSADVNSPKSQKMKQLVHRIDYRETGSELLALLLESDLIKRHQPVFNRSQRQTRYRYGLFVETTSQGYISYTLQRLNRYQPDTEFNNMVIVFSNKKQADAFLNRAIEKYQLCGKLVGIAHTRGPCFHYHLKRCFGACVGEETVESYNTRAKKLMQQYNYEDESFVILTRGRTPTEKGFVWIHKGVYRGFGYLPVAQAKHISIKTLQRYLTPLPDNQDIRKIINRYLKTTRSLEKIVFG